MGVRLPCWEFRGPSGSSSRVHGSLNSARIFIVGSPCSFLGLLSVGIFLASARLRSRSDVPKTHAPGARHLLRNRPQARRVKRVSGIFISKENQHRIHYRSTVVCVLPYQLPYIHCLPYRIPLPLAPREAPKIRMWLNSGHSNPFPIPGNRKGIRVIAVKIQTPAKMYRLSAREEILVHSIIKEQRTKSPCI